MKQFKRQSVKVSIENGAQLLVFLPVSLSEHGQTISYCFKTQTSNEMTHYYTT